MNYVNGWMVFWLFGVPPLCAAVGFLLGWFLHP